MNRLVYILPSISTRNVATWAGKSDSDSSSNSASIRASTCCEQLLLRDILPVENIMSKGCKIDTSIFTLAEKVYLSLPCFCSPSGSVCGVQTETHFLKQNCLRAKKVEEQVNRYFLLSNNYLNFYLPHTYQVYTGINKSILFFSYKPGTKIKVSDAENSLPRDSSHTYIQILSQVHVDQNHFGDAGNIHGIPTKVPNQAHVLKVSR